MKHWFLFRNITFAAALFFAATAGAQQTNTLQVAKAGYNTAAIISLAPQPVSAADEIVLAGLKLRNEKLYRHFTAAFQNATNISIYPEAKATVIYCLVNGIRNNIVYTGKAKLEHVIRYYEPSLLPAPISSFVEDAFPGYKMTHVAEITIGGKTAYLVGAENKKKNLTIRVTDGLCDVYQEYNRQQ